MTYYFIDEGLKGDKVDRRDNYFMHLRDPLRCHGSGSKIKDIIY